MRKKFNTFWQAISPRGNPLRHWVLIFVLINFSNVVNFGNAAARLATLASMSERHAFWIEPYLAQDAWTDDVAQTPDGHVYSNKPPGPMLVGFPLFWAMDKAFTAGVPTEKERDHVRYKRRYVSLFVLSFFLQILPTAALVLFMARFLAARGVSFMGIQLAGLGVLFGNTASIYMNTFSGHAFTALWVTAVALALPLKRWGWLGLFFGLAVMTDHGSLFVLPALVLAIWLQEKRADFFSAVPRIVLGGAVPALALGWYNWVCFGSPFSIAHKFLPQQFKDVTDEHQLWGIFHALPNPEAIYGLLFGSSRGMLWTQPWILLGLAWLASRALRRLPRGPYFPLSVFAVGGWLGLLFMNSMFGAWHGGGGAGPRYLSPIFATFALVLALRYREISAAWRRAFFVGLGYSAFFLAVCYSTFITVPVEPLWKSYLNFFFVNPTYTPPLRLAVLLLGFGLGIRKTLQLARLETA